MANRPTQLIPTDPLFGQQWHLLNTGQISESVVGFDTNVTKVWPDYTGLGVLVAALDDGFDESHPDLAGNYRSDLAWDFSLNQPGANPVLDTDSHGTSAGGLVFSLANNGIGGVGTAWGVNFVGYRMDLGESTTVDQISQYFDGAAERIIRNGASVFTNSWGVMESPFDAQSQQNQFVSTAQRLAEEGRDGLGVIILFSAGNDRDNDLNTNYDPTNNIPFSINVAASKADGQITSYSTPGASVLVSSPGSDPGSIVTTDWQGFEGYNTESGVAGNYTSTEDSYFNGTSASAPIAAGVVALILQANPNLGYRDVQEILVYSSKRDVFLNNPEVEATVNRATDWNGGGLLTGYDFGYGNIDALAAVRLAESWQKQNTVSNLLIVNGIVDQRQFSLDAGDTGTFSANFSSDNRVEQVTVSLDLSTERLQDVQVELIGPDGTSSIIINYPPVIDGEDIPQALTPRLTYTLNTVRHWGESLNGDWTLRIVNEETGAPLILNDWSIQAYTADPTADNVQIFTDEYTTFVAQDSSRLVLNSANGNAINAAAVSTASILDLAGGPSHIGGVSIMLEDPHAFKIIIGGDGDDILVGNALNNLLMGGRGSNILDGGSGIDTVQFIGDRAIYEVIENTQGAQNVISTLLSGGGLDTLVDIERLMFTDTNIALDINGVAGKAYRIYQAAFDRAPDVSGLGYWINVMDNGAALTGVAGGFIGSDEFQSRYGNASDGDFITLLYENVLDRQPDEGGYSFWEEAIERGLTHEGLLVEFSESRENVSNVAGLIANGIEYTPFIG